MLELLKSISKAVTAARLANEGNLDQAKLLMLK